MPIKKQSCDTKRSNELSPESKSGGLNGNVRQKQKKNYSSRKAELRKYYYETHKKAVIY